MAVSPFTPGLSPIERIQVAIYSYATRPTANSTAAIVIWLAGAAATKTFLEELGIVGQWTAVLAGLLALVLQAMLTLLQGPVWHSSLRTQPVRTLFAFGALVIDTALNTGGCWYWLQNLGNTTFWQAIAISTNTPTGPAPLTILGLSLLIGLAISAGPEALYDL